MALTTTSVQENEGNSEKEVPFFINQNAVSFLKELEPLVKSINLLFEKYGIPDVNNTVQFDINKNKLTTTFAIGNFPLSSVE